ncbi:hypothetical protein MACH17_44130 [Phaeobacter inhibens]|nr:hypothetical protein MACH17_44130 [Phaeobacter inhibens]
MGATPAGAKGERFYLWREDSIQRYTLRLFRLAEYGLKLRNFHILGFRPNEGIPVDKTKAYIKNNTLGEMPDGANI